MQPSKYYPIIKPPSQRDPKLNPVGIDVGTTRCCVAVNRANGIEAVAIDSGLRVMPSYVSYEEVIPKCGQIVCNRIKHYVKNSVFDVKRIIGKSLGSIVIDNSWPFKVAEVKGDVKIVTKNASGADISLSPEEITSILIKHMKNKVEEFQGQTFSEAVLTVPAAFNQAQINSTTVAAVLAGIETVHILPEPVAACLTYASKQEIPENSTILLFDLGGGTLDICIIRIKDQNLHILGNFGDLYLGGRDFDAVLMNHFIGILKNSYNIDLINDMNDAKLLKRYKLMLRCQEIKHDLQDVESAWLDLDDVDGSLEGQITIKKDEFEKFSEGLLLRIKFKILEALNSLNLNASNIDFVLQAGGGCNMKSVKNLLKTVFPNAQHLCTVDPDWAVAFGATLYSHYLKTKPASKGDSTNQESSRSSNTKSHEKPETSQQPSSNMFYTNQTPSPRNQMTRGSPFESIRSFLAEVHNQNNFQSQSRDLPNTSQSNMPQTAQPGNTNEIVSLINQATAESLKQYMNKMQSRK